jgi:hypothetical protein
MLGNCCGSLAEPRRYPSNKITALLLPVSPGRLRRNTGVSPRGAPLEMTSFVTGPDNGEWRIGRRAETLLLTFAGEPNWGSGI